MRAHFRFKWYLPQAWRLLTFITCTCLCSTVALAQHAQLSGMVRDDQAGVLANAEARLVDEASGVLLTTRSNERGHYVFASVRPGQYRFTVAAPGFAMYTRSSLVLYVDQRAVLDVTLSLAGLEEEVKVGGARPLIGMADGSLGTVIDRQFAADLPVRGRSFSALVSLAPGVSAIPGGAASGDGSEFQVNGQRSVSNNLTVDGVSAPAEMGAGGFRNAAGQRFSTTATGSVNGGLSIDAVQEIRVQTSSFAAEFGRTPGAQISLVTRSGTNRFGGSAFEQFRDDRLIANDWFANSRGVPKPTIDEHQFGLAIGGPLVRSRLFFFASYEGLRLSQPTFGIQNVPSVEARQQQSPVSDALKVYPLPTGTTRPNGTAEYAAYNSLRYEADTFGLRVDHAGPRGMQLFGRYSQVPSTREDDSPFASNAVVEQTARSMTGGMTATLGGRSVVELRGSYAEAKYATARSSALREWFPGDIAGSPVFQFGASGLATVYTGNETNSTLRQGSFVAALSHLWRSHHIKIGIDHRRLWPRDAGLYSVSARYGSLAEALTASAVSSLSIAHRFPVTATFQNSSVYAQDTWKAGSRLSVMYGVRWDVNPAPSFAPGEGPLAVVMFEPVSELTLSTSKNTPLWKTDYGGVFPRIGFSYRLDSEGRTVLSGGAGIFGDISSTSAGPAVRFAAGAQTQLIKTRVPLPLSPDDVRGIEEVNLLPPHQGVAVVIDPHLATPRTAQWNLSVQRALGDQQEAVVSYVAAEGRRLLDSRQYNAGINPDFAEGISVVTSNGRSTYHALQIQHRSRFGWGVQSLTSYTFGQAKDTLSRLFSIDQGNQQLEPSLSDLRHMLTGALSWSPPSPPHWPAKWLWNDWGIHLMALARSGYPFTVESSAFVVLPGQENLQWRASLVPGVPIVIKDESAPGGRRYNRAAFVDPVPGEQGNTGRNAFRGLSAFQLDAGLQRSIALGRGMKVRVRIDAFNVLNNPVFALPDGFLGSSTFGVPIAMESSGFRTLYRAGGARSLALSVRLDY